MSQLAVPEPFSCGIFLSYQCTNTCKHCMYACSPGWKADWISEEDAERVLSLLAEGIRGKHSYRGMVGLNDGVHFTGGEPFLNFGLLLRVTEIAEGLGLPWTFVETNSFWCRDDEAARERLMQLKGAGLEGILISANPFVIEQVPFERVERAARIGQEVFGDNVMVYQRFFFDQFRRLGLKGTLPLEEYLRQAGYGLHHVELLPNGRVSYKLGHLFTRYPAERFLGELCRRELIRDWHIHVDNYCNFVPGYCGGISLGDARDLHAICQGIDLDERPVLKALLTDMRALRELGRQFGYQEREGYVSKCHLCVDIRRHLVRHGQFKELRPEEFYDHLEDG